MQKSLVFVVNGEPLASSDVIAQGMHARHKSVIQLIRNQSKVLSEFGTLAFEMRKSAGRPTEIAMLNEQQAALLISMMRNSQEVVAFKVSLIREFYRMRDALQQRDDNLWKQMQALIAKEVESKVRASFGSNLMLERKREIPGFKKKFEELEAAIQPGLPMQ